MRLALELALARSVGRLSRLAGRGGGTTLPGKILATIDPGAVVDPRRPAAARDGRDLGDERQDDDGRAGRRDPRHACPARPQRLRREPRLGRRLDAARGARRRARPVRGRRGRVSRDREADPPPRGVPRQPVPRPARPLRRAGADRRALAGGRRGASGGDHAGRQRRRPAGRRPGRRRPGSVTFGLDDPAQARPSLQHAADSKYCLRCGTPYVYAAAYVGHLGDYRCPACGHARPAARPRRRERSSCTGSRRSRSTSSPRRARAASGWACPGSTTSTTRSPPPRSRGRSAPRSTRSSAGLERPRRRSDASSGSTSATGGCCCC